ncbi:CHAD domain-containing protein [Candidatus Oscillochloris fontis]|uniref:CHAD domain-containing protein n=1 Tax=Candidatus Oscillochloris fontis TaxID=2496868 RepID=UPI00101C26FA|nr:CHAD domain-containing protein [Candidatus Oscillochloris fontis]
MHEPGAALAEILTTYRVNLSHVRAVTAHALALFDALADHLSWPDHSRLLLEYAGLLHDVGLSSDPPNHHVAGRDIVLHHQIADLTPTERGMVACLVAFHRKRVRPQQEPAFLSLPKKQRPLVLQLAAILRVADGLDYSHTQSTRIVALEPSATAYRLNLEGPQAASDGARAITKADLWQRSFDLPLELGVVVTSAEVAVIAPESDVQEHPLLPPWYAAPTTTLAELGRVLLRRYLRRLIATERAIRADRDHEEIHVLRVTSRRLRATLHLLAPVAPAKHLRPIHKAIRRLARSAGAVRDRDVLLVHLAQSRADLPTDLHVGLDELVATLTDQRSAAYQRLITLFDSPDYAQFKERFAHLINTAEGWNEQPQVRDLAGSTIWRHYEALRAHDQGHMPLDGPPMHALRIDAKKLRYVLELFAASFNERADLVVDQLTNLQDDLGILNDTIVAEMILESVTLSPTSQPAVTTYLALRENERRSAQASLPARWAKITSATYRRRLMELIVKL